MLSACIITGTQGQENDVNNKTAGYCCKAKFIQRSRDGEKTEIARSRIVKRVGRLPDKFTVCGIRGAVSAAHYRPGQQINELLLTGFTVSGVVGVFIIIIISMSTIIKREFESITTIIAEENLINYFYPYT